MNNLIRNTVFPRFTSFSESPLKPFTALNFSLFDDFFEGAFDEHRAAFPYNTVAIDENNYLIEIALAGWNKEDFSVELDGNSLNVYSKVQESTTETKQTQPKDKQETISSYPYYLHRGIAKRSFSFKFTLPKDAEVGTPSFKDGLLVVKITKSEAKTSKAKLLTIK